MTGKVVGFDGWTYAGLSLPVGWVRQVGLRVRGLGLKRRQRGVYGVGFTCCSHPSFLTHASDNKDTLHQTCLQAGFQSPTLKPAV